MYKCSLHELEKFLEEIQKLKRQEVEDLLFKVKKGWRCRGCSKTSKNKYLIGIHAEMHVTGLIYPCQICAKKCPSRSKLRYHMGKQHDGGVIRKKNITSTALPALHQKVVGEGKARRNTRRGWKIEKKEDEADQKKAVKALMSEETDGWRCLSCSSF